ncbi:RRM domain-containing protein [Plasmodiophora brassicae]|uniref:RRM domain-containing protein n=1 Tax=Plasmodiophora brassicae TaxID=37360 RepID=A0A0G4IN64_PLABS|nr:hypothetical protein PBRA_005221 [Plasmodiophora brassicae]SPQ94667.1 unnamed protein product [Plasmodiophora brassicae]
MSASDTCALYVGNISFKTTDESLAELFAGMGIVSAEVIKSRTGRSRGFGIVKFHTADEADAAISKVDQTEFEGRKVFVRHDQKPDAKPIVESGNEDASSVYLGNLPYAATSESLEELLGNEPGFKSVEVIIERRTNRSRGFAIASFDSAEHAKAAIDKYDQSELDGRTIQARIDHGRRRRHGRDGPGEHEEGE